MRWNNQMTAIILLVLAACTNPRVNAREHFRITYSYSDNTRYCKLQIDSTNLKYTYYVAPGSIQQAAGSRYYTDADLVTVNSGLEQDELDALADAVNRSGFLRLPDTCGGDPGDADSRPYALGVGTFWREKVVVYVDSPSAATAPAAFRELAGRLAGAVSDKFELALAVPD